MARQLKSTGNSTSTRTTSATGGAKRTAARKAASKCSPKPPPTEEQIRTRAYEIYQRRAGGPGDALSDWLQAERELREQC